MAGQLKLYGKTSKGQIKVWTGEVIDNTTHSIIRITHGLQDGKMQTSEKIISCGKNIGKKNETTHQEQALSELQSLYNKKKDSGYADAILDIQEASYHLPMLAKEYIPGKTKLKFPVLAQPKLDGIRCVSDRYNQWSRKQKVFKTNTTVQTHLEIQSLIQLLVLLTIVFDGELYIPGKTFEEIQSIVTDSDSITDETIEYHIFDIVDETLPFEERMKVLDSIDASFKHLKKVETVIINSEAELDAYLEKCLEAGYEGIIIRNPKGLYKKQYRSSDLLKYKLFKDAEYKIIDVNQGIGKDAGTAIFVCITEDNETFSVRPKGKLAKRQEYWNNRDQYIGTYLKVKYQNLTSFGVPRFPVGLGIRDLDL